MIFLYKCVLAHLIQELRKAAKKSSSTNGQAIKREGGKGRAIKPTVEFSNFHSRFREFWFNWVQFKTITERAVGLRSGVSTLSAFISSSCHIPKSIGCRALFQHPSKSSRSKYENDTKKIIYFQLKEAGGGEADSISRANGLAVFRHKSALVWLQPWK